MDLPANFASGAALVALWATLSLTSLSATAQDETTPPGVEPPAPSDPVVPREPTDEILVTEIADHERLLGARVVDFKGDAIGEVESVKVDTDGRIAAVNVDVGEETVALEAEGMTYAEASNSVTTQQSKKEIDDLR
jgi:sporulation protein YlmC with PRC-barrel domain